MRDLIRLSVFGALLFSSLAISGQSFTRSIVDGENFFRPTSMEWGPDQRLYLAQQSGKIYAYTIERVSVTDYNITATEEINLIRDIPNYNDDGTSDPTQNRQCTGITVVGTPTNPVIYATSSDSRIGGNTAGTDTGLDTNSGIISRLRWNGTSWEKVDLIRGLPRSEENHSTNGLLLDQENNILYVCSGGNTNGGAPSKKFAYLCETALTTAILEIDMDMIDSMPVLTDTAHGHAYVYDLPTLDDPERSNANGVDHPDSNGYDGVDLNDPFGGNDGLNQAKLVAGGPVQIYASGLRNTYDVVIAENGYMYTWDNGANLTWGGLPFPDEGPGIATNNWVPSEWGSLIPCNQGTYPNCDPSVVNNQDGLHKISYKGYYAGHPNPIRCNPDSAYIFTLATGTDGNNGVFRTTYDFNSPSTSLPYDWPPVDSALANPIEGDFQNPGVTDSSLYTHMVSTNGLVEYTASNFGDSLNGNLLAAAFNGRIYRVKLNASGGIDGPSSVSTLSSGIGIPIDVTALGDGTLFPGTVWTADYNANRLYVLEPNDFQPCSGIDSTGIDEDGDGYTNADEIDNGTNPCNNADRPDDFDKSMIGGFMVSNLNDPDDDDDGIVDSLDYFAWDSLNGQNLQIPVDYPLLNGDPGFGFYGLGFTGLMMNLQDDYLDLWKTEENSNLEIIAGGAVGALTFNNLDSTDALGSINTQTNGFQFGVAVDSTQAPFAIEMSVDPSFVAPQDSQSMGMFFGVGDQDNYVKLVINAQGDSAGIAMVMEDGGVDTAFQYQVAGLIGAASIRLYLVVNPSNGMVLAQYSTEATTWPVDLGQFRPISGPLLSTLKDSNAIAVGVIATARGSMSQFNATWDNISLYENPLTSGEWVYTNDATSCNPIGTPGSCCQGRHEASFVQSGDKFYLLGGRENSSNVNIYDPATDTWTVGADAPFSLHHFQAVDLHGLILAAGAFTGNFPIESPVDKILIYDPVTDTWHDGPSIPADRLRGSAGTVVRDDKLYLVSGIELGHLFGHVPWLDEYDPVTDTWTALADAPRSRDHFHAAMHNGKIYAAAGRRSGQQTTFLPTEPLVDVYDIDAQQWSTLSDSIPTERAGNTVAVLGDEILVIGGERESGSAKNETEALDVSTGTWRSMADLNQGRHGTQAIVNNNAIYVAAGSPNQGGGTLQSTEAFYLYGPSTPILNTTIQSVFAADSTLDFGQQAFMDTALAILSLRNAAGNQALLVDSLKVLSGANFWIESAINTPRIILPGDSIELVIGFLSNSINTFSDTLYIGHTGSNAPFTKVLLEAEAIFVWPGGERLYVDSSATGSSQFGDSWANALLRLDTALQLAVQIPEIREIWIAGGTYFPATGAGRTASFAPRDSLSMYGGFVGSETFLSDRTTGSTTTILSGDLGAKGDTSDNAYHVIEVGSNRKAILFDRVLVENGNANGTGMLQTEGAGILNLGETTLRDVVVRNCYSSGPGAVISNQGSGADLKLERISTLGNHSDVLIHVYNIANGSIRFASENELWE